METRTIQPSPQYLSKLRLICHIIAVLSLASGLLLGLLISLDPDVGSNGFSIAGMVTAGLVLLFWIPAMLLVGPYYRSLSYEIHEDEVIVRAGIITKSVKHVPYRTVTNLTVVRGLLDRWFFGLGALNIQTAGMSGTTGVEESLVGLPNYDEIYEIVAAELRRFRGAMAPTAAEVEGEPKLASPEALNELLTEVRAIRQAVEGNSQRVGGER